MQSNGVTKKHVFATSSLRRIDNPDKVVDAVKNRLSMGQLIGLRNVTAHNYENIIDDIIWEVRHEDVYEIKEYLEKILYN